MSDIAQILGVGTSKASSLVPAPAAPPPPLPPGHQPPRATKGQTLSREVVHLLGGNDAKHSTLELPMSVPSFPIQRLPPTATNTTQAPDDIANEPGDLVKVGAKFISRSKPARKWAWAPFSSSARTDGALFCHWVRANVEYPDYPYARFDIHLDPVTYTDEEYNKYLQSETWSRSQTDFLLETARRFELRWPIIHDRWVETFGVTSPEKIEDLQHRYYSVASKLNAARVSQEAAKEVQSLVAQTAAVAAPDNPHSKELAEALLIETAAARALATSEPEQQPLIQTIGTGTTNKVFDLEYERERRAHMEALWCRSKDDEFEEVEIRKELKQLEGQLRKLKKTGRHVLAAGNGKSPSGAVSSTNPSRAVSPVPNVGIDAAALDQAFASTAPTPMPQTPYIQSGRLAHPATGGSAGLNKTLLNRMDEMLDELKIPIRPIATKRVCDLYDQVRRDALCLLVLQKQLIQKEGAIQSKRLRLAKMGGDVRVVDEETLMGIAPPAAAPAAAATKGKSKTGAGKTKAALATSTTGASVPKTAKSPRPANATAAGANPAKPGGTSTAPSSKVAAKDGTAQGKQPSTKKPAVKRKRKAESTEGKPVDASGTKPVAVSTEAQPPATTSAAAASRPEEGTKPTKKRPKKAPPSST